MGTEALVLAPGCRGCSADLLLSLLWRLGAAPPSLYGWRCVLGSLSAGSPVALQHQNCTVCRQGALTLSV